MNKNNSEHLVIFNDGKNSTAVIFVHPVGGQVHWYREISKQFGDDFSVYSFMSDGLLDESRRFISIKTMSDHYIKSILHQRSYKNYIIIGWSFGGEVAFEMTKSLIEKQHKASLVLLDPQVMVDKTMGINTCFYEVLKKEYGVSLKGEVALSGLDEGSIDVFILELVEHMVSSKYIKDTYKKYYVMSLRVYLYNLINMRRYQREGHVQNVLMAVAEKNANDIFSFMRQATLLDWKPYASLIKKIIIPGDHYSMLQGQSATQIVSDIVQQFPELKEKKL